MIQQIIIGALTNFVLTNAIDWTDKGIDYLLKKIKEAELNTPGSGQGSTKWHLVWNWILEDAGDAISQHKDKIEGLVGTLVNELNKKKLW